jgi:hypothetical protein
MKSTKSSFFNFRKEKKILFRKRTPKGEPKSATKEENDGAIVLAKLSVTSDVDDEKEKKKDRELLVK